MLKSLNGKWREVNTDTYSSAVKRATKAASDGQNYFVYRDLDNYGRQQWQIISERMYYECFVLPESWVKAYVGASGIIEAY